MLGGSDMIHAQLLWVDLGKLSDGSALKDQNKWQKCLEGKESYRGCIGLNLSGNLGASLNP